MTTTIILCVMAAVLGFLGGYQLCYRRYQEEDFTIDNGVVLYHGEKRVIESVVNELDDRIDALEMEACGKLTEIVDEIDACPPPGTTAG